MDKARARQPLLLQFIEPFPCPATPCVLTAPTNDPYPQSSDLGIELSRCFHVARYRMVIRESTNYACQPSARLLQGSVHTLDQLFFDFLKLPAESLSDGDAHDAEPALARLSTDMRETQIVKGLGFALSAFASIALCKPPEFDQPCLRRM